MKSTSVFIVLLLIALLVDSCSDDFGRTEKTAMPTMNSLSAKRSYDEALWIAQNAIGMLDRSEGKTRGKSPARRISLPETHIIRSGEETPNVDSLALTYPRHDIDMQYFNWGNICKHILYYKQNGQELSIYCTASDSAHNAISRLCRQLGDMMNSDYVNASNGPFVVQIPELIR